MYKKSGYFSQKLSTNLSKAVLLSTSPAEMFYGELTAGMSA